MNEQSEDKDTKITCPQCNSVINKREYSRHCKSKKHLKSEFKKISFVSQKITVFFD